MTRLHCEAVQVRWGAWQGLIRQGTVPARWTPCWRPGPSHQPGCDPASCLLLPPGSFSLSSPHATLACCPLMVLCSSRTPGRESWLHKPLFNTKASTGQSSRAGPPLLQAPSAYPTGKCQVNPWPGQLQPGCGLPCPAVPVVPPGAVGEACLGESSAQSIAECELFL